MAQITVNLSNRLLNKLYEIQQFEDATYEDGHVSISDLIEEALMGHYEISIQDLQFEEQLEIQGINYVYAILDPQIDCLINIEGYTFHNEPIYIGKGQGSRAYSHLTSANNEALEARIEDIRKNEHEPIITLLETNLYNNQACALENNLIYAIGRKDLGLGTLLNASSGIYKTDIDEKGNFMDLETAKAKQILIAINENRYLKHAAQALGISERTLYRKIKQYGMEQDKRTGLYKMSS